MNSLKPMRNITRKINLRRKSSKGINLKENLKPTHPKNVNVDYIMKKSIMQINVLRKKVNIKMFENFNDLELITNNEDVSDNDSIYYLSEETLNSLDWECL